MCKHVLERFILLFYLEQSYNFRTRVEEIKFVNDKLGALSSGFDTRIYMQGPTRNRGREE